MAGYKNIIFMFVHIAGVRMLFFYTKLHKV